MSKVFSDPQSLDFPLKKLHQGINAFSSVVAARVASGEWSKSEINRLTIVNNKLEQIKKELLQMKKEKLLPTFDIFDCSDEEYALANANWDYVPKEHKVGEIKAKNINDACKLVYKDIRAKKYRKGVAVREHVSE